MHDEHADASPRRHRLPAVVGALLTAAAFGTSTLLLGASAQAKTPTPTYHSGSDTATFTVTGILDKNCLVSVGGDKVYIKPGDSIDFKSSVAGVSVNTTTSGGVLGGLGGGLTTLTGSQLAGLNVSAVLDKGTHHAHSFNVDAGKTTTVTGLSSGTHTLAWKAESVKVLPSLGGATVPMSSATLKSGAKLSWSGHIYVTSGAPDCRLSVSTPKVSASAGPVHIGLPGVTVTTPVDPNKVVGNLNPKKGTSTKTGTTTKKSTTTSGSKSNDQNQLATGKDGLLPVPARVVPGGYGSTTYGGGGGFYGASLNGAAGSSGYAPLTMTNPDGSTTSLNAAPSADQQKANAASTKKDEPSAQLPVVLAIIAVIALALVASTYARLFLLRRQT